MIQTKVLTSPASGLQRLMEPNETTSPSGSANSSVRAKSSQLSRNAPDRRIRITDTKTHLFYSESIFPSIISGKSSPCLGAFHASATKSLPHRGRLHRKAMTEEVLQHTQSASAKSYLSASACMVPSAFSASKASSTAAAASLPLRNATPYSSAFSSSTIFRSA